jgi:hypothetical protein
MFIKQYSVWTPWMVCIIRRRQISFLYREPNHRFFARPVRSLVTVLTELPRISSPFVVCLYSEAYANFIQH